MSDSQNICKNCGFENSKTANFCEKCGQKIGDKLNFKILFYNTIGNYFSFDARFFRSIIPLLFKPGFIAKEFVNGKRLKYLHPGQMYLFVTVIFFFVFSYYVREGRQEIDKNSKSLFSKKDKTITELDSILKIDSISINVKNGITNNKNIPEETRKQLDSLMKQQNLNNQNQIDLGSDMSVIDSLIAINAPKSEIYKAMGMADDAGYLKRKFYTQALKLYQTMGFGQLFQYFIDSIPISMFILMPLFAFILKLFYFKKGNYSHHLVFSFYYFCFLFFVFSIVLGVNRVIDIPNWLDFIILSTAFIYLWLAIIRFYKQGWFLSLVKTATIMWLYLFLVIPLATAILFLIAFLYY